MFFALIIFNFVQAHGKKILANLINRNGQNFSMVKIVILYQFDIAMPYPLIIKDSNTHHYDIKRNDTRPS
jgi:hypothetical protein